MSTLEFQWLCIFDSFLYFTKKEKKKSDLDLREVMGLLPGFTDKFNLNLDVCIPSLDLFPRELRSKKYLLNLVLTLGT